MGRKQVRFVGDKVFSRVDEYGRDIYVLVTDSQEIKAILEYIGKSKEEFGFLLVKTDNGDYEEVWAPIDGSIPYVWVRVKRIK